MPPYIKDH